MRHAVFLEDEVMRGSTVSREIRLQEKRVYVPTPMVEEPFFSIPAAVTPIVQDNVIAEPVVDSPVAMVVTSIVGSLIANFDEVEESIFQEPITNHEKEQQQRFCHERKEHMECRLKKSIYGLNQASRQWYLKFDETIRNFGFKENEEDNCIYAKFRNRKFIFLYLVCG
jgi:hypothetical protein